MTDNMTQIGISLPPAIVSRLDEFGAWFGLSRSAVTRVIIAMAMNMMSESDMAERIKTLADSITGESEEEA